MAAIRLQAYTGTVDGIASCDFRGDKAPTGDETVTLYEIDPATDEQIAVALVEGRKINASLAKIGLVAAMPLNHLVVQLGKGLEPGLRLGVWDE